MYNQRGTPVGILLLAGACIALATVLGAGRGITQFWTGAGTYVRAIQTDMRERQLIITPVRPTPTPGIPALTGGTRDLQVEIYEVYTSIRRLADASPMPDHEKRLMMNIALINKGEKPIDLAPDVLTLVDEWGVVSQPTHFGLVGDRIIGQGQRVYGEIGFTIARGSSRVALRCRDADRETTELVINLSAPADGVPS